MLYFEDYASLRSSLNAEELVSVLDAMTRYSDSGSLPDENNFSPAAKICWRFMKPKIDRDSQNYLDVCAKRADAANKRWSAKASDSDKDTKACKCIDSIQKVQVHDFMPTTTQLQPNSTATAAVTHDCASPTASDGDSTLSEQIAAHQRADDLIRRYQLPDGDTSREALLEDAERIGWPKLEEALQAASRSNSRQRLSVNFYRRFLSNAPMTKGDEWLAIENL